MKCPVFNFYVHDFAATKYTKINKKNQQTTGKLSAGNTVRAYRHQCFC